MRTFRFCKIPLKIFFRYNFRLNPLPLALFLYLSLSSPLKSHTFSTFSNTLFALFPQEIFSPKKYFFFSKILFMFTSSIVSFPPLINSHISPFILDQILPLFLSFFLHSALIAPRWSSVLFSLPIPRLQSFS